MTTPELEQYLLSLEPTEQLHIIQILTQSLLINPAIVHNHLPQRTQKSTLMSAIATLRKALLSEGIEIDPDEIWGDVRDRTPVSDQPRW